MENSVSVKTITKVVKSTGAFNIKCYSDMNNENNTFPSIYESNILETPMEIDNIEGLENELIILETEDSDTILDQGELIINTLEDIEDRYSIDDENLIYNG